MAKELTEDFTKWVDSLDENCDLTVEQLILMQEAWNAALEFIRLQRIDEIAAVRKA